MCLGNLYVFHVFRLCVLLGGGRDILQFHILSGSPLQQNARAWPTSGNPSTQRARAFSNTAWDNTAAARVTKHNSERLWRPSPAFGDCFCVRVCLCVCVRTLLHSNIDGIGEGRKVRRTRGDGRNGWEGSGGSERLQTSEPINHLNIWEAPANRDLAGENRTSNLLFLHVCVSASGSGRSIKDKAVEGELMKKRGKYRIHKNRTIKGFHVIHWVKWRGSSPLSPSAPNPSLLWHTGHLSFAAVCPALTQ